MIVHVVAGAAAVGAWFRPDLGWWLVVVAGGAAARTRHVVAVAVAVLLVFGWWSARAVDGFDPPAAGPVEGWVTLTGDPRPSGPVGVRASAQWGSHRVSLSAHGPVGGRLDDRLAGERVRVVGSFRPLRSTDDHARWRHEVGTIVVTEIDTHSMGSPLTRFANGVRRLLAGGAGSLGRDDRAVFTGMVLGDDREQRAVVADDFRAAGLGHLLVVSGQNVAFVIALLGPLTNRLRPIGRLGVVVVALVVFVTITRFEASVLRAAMMAGLSVGAAVLGGPVDGRRALSASIITLLALDPFLVRVLAFQLSVCATGGIVWLSAPLAERLRGPQVVRVAVATTTSAQLAVSPLLVATFGPVPLAALPANLLAGPVSGPIMMWGCTGGLVAGVLGEPMASWIHLPTESMVGWVRAVARSTATAPPVGLSMIDLTLVSAAIVGLMTGRPVLRSLGAAALTVALLHAIAATPAVAGSASLGVGVDVHAATHTVLVLDDPHGPRRVLDAVRSAGVRRVDLIVATDGDRADADAVVALIARYGAVPVVAPPLHRVPTARSLHPGTTLIVGAARVEAVQLDDGVELVVVPCAVGACDTGREEAP